MRRGTLIAIALIALATLGAASTVAETAAPAAKKPNRYRTKLTISSSVPAFSGRVKSRKRRCERRRKVVLFRRGNGSRRHRLGADRSNRRGRWAIPVDNLRSGAYFAKVRRKRLRGKGGGSVCRPARSRIAVIT